MKNEIDISIIIPSFNCKKHCINISNLLIALKNQELIDVNFEIILIDNTDSSEDKIITNKFRQHIKNLKIIQEPIVGLSYARNCGILKSRGKIIAFLDDDVIPSKKWLNTLLNAHKTSNALCIGGPVIIKDKNSIYPEWFTDYFLRFLLPPKFPRDSGKITKPFYLIGANLSFKRIVFERYGLFDTSLGRKGTCLLSGEDIEFILRLNPDDIRFESKALVFTKIKPERLSRYFFLKRIFWQAVSEARITKKHKISRLYDKTELLLSKDLFNNFLRALIKVHFFQLFCVVIRFVTFKLTLLFKL